MSMNPFEVIQKTKDLANKLFAAEKLMVPRLQTLAKRGAENHPNDQTLRMMYNVLQRMNEHDKMFITRGEFRELYNKFATNGNKASGYFTKELALDELPKGKVMKYSEDASRDIIQEAFDNTADKSILNALNEVWDDSGKLNKNAEYKMYNPDTAEKAASVAHLTLVRMGLEPKTVKTFAGSTDFIICDATYDSFKGEAHVLIPMETSASGVLIPNMFVTKYGFADLTKPNLVKHIADSSGNSLLVKASDLMNTLKTAKKITSMNEIELQIAIAESKEDSNIVRTATDKSSLALTENPVFVSLLEPKQATDLQLPVMEQTQSFAAMLESQSGLAKQIFGEKVVENGRQVIASKLQSFGLNSQVAVASCDEDNIIYAVRLDTGTGPFGFHVLAEVTNKKVHIPNLIATKDKPYEFSKEGINKALQSQMSDIGMLAKISPMYDLKPSEIMDRLRSAADKKDYKTAEDALNIIAEKCSPELYATAMAEFMRSLSASKLEKTASTKSGCKMIIHTANHIGPVCGHLNLPLDQVHQDEHGHCRRAYRQHINDTYEGLMFNANKVFLDK
ncbi:MAG TPA: hypothetical protein VMX17_13940 [Candidatus Glassbacteria bacterium]|nr:hypothetical protein [Candidatus Glassbacteria bacterium]